MDADCLMGCYGDERRWNISEREGKKGEGWKYSQSSLFTSLRCDDLHNLPIDDFLVSTSTRTSSGNQDVRVMICLMLENLGVPVDIQTVKNIT